MDAGVISIIVALIGGFSAILANLVSFRKENKDDHETVNLRLTHLTQSVDKVGEKLDEHIHDHAKGMM